MNYEQVLKDVDAIERFAPEVVVLDEAQRIKNWQTRTAAVVKRLQPRYRLVMTGTPMENRLGELASVVEWVDDLALEPKWRLGAVHAQRDADGAVVGARGLDTLRSRLEGCLLRRSREAVCSRLPLRRDERVHRHGQLLPVDVVCFVSEGIEQHIEQVVGGKQALFRGLFDGGGDAVSFEQSGSFLERLREVAAHPVVLDDGVARVKALLAGVEVRAAGPGRVALEAPVEVMTQLAGLLQRAARLVGTSS